MRFVLNALSLRSGGGQTVGLGVVSNLNKVAPTDEFLVLASPGVGYEKCAGHGVSVECIDWPDMGSLGRVRLLNIDVARICREFQADALFSMGNMPAISVSVPQLVLFHLPHFVYPEVARTVLPWGQHWKMRFRKLYAGLALRHSTITVQTEVMRKRFVDNFPVPQERVIVVPSAGVEQEGADLGAEPGKEAKAIRMLDGRFRLLYLTRYYRHKNVEVLLDVARLLRGKGVEDVVLLTTLSQQQGPEARLFLDEVKNRGLHDVIVNLGPIPREQVHNCLSACDALVMPTLLETFGLPYLEAMNADCPILTSDRDFSRAVCKDAALYFDPLNPESIVEALLLLKDDSELRRVLSVRGRDYLACEYLTWEEITKEYVSILHALASA